MLLTPEERKIKEEAQEFARSIDPELIRKMEREEVKFPKEFIQMAAERRLLGLRFPPEYGGRGATWVAEVAAIEEIGGSETVFGLSNFQTFS